MGNKYNYVITNLTNNCIQSTLLYTCTYNLILMLDDFIIVVIIILSISVYVKIGIFKK